MKPTPLPILALLAVLGLGSAQAQVPSLLNYQGRVTVGGTNFTGNGEFKFALVDGGTDVSETATGTGTVNSGFLTSITVNDGGSGYTTPPAVTILDDTGSGATATASVSSGSVTSITVNNPGTGYSPTPTITIAPPPADIVYQTYWDNTGGTNSVEPSAAVPLAVGQGLYAALLGDPALANMAPIPPAVFTNTDVNLRVWFSPGGTNDFVLLSPDQRLGAAGYALRAAAADTATVTNVAGNLTVSGTLTAYQLIGGSNSTVGGTNATVSGGLSNTASTDYATVGGGLHNTKLTNRVTLTAFPDRPVTIGR